MGIKYYVWFMREKNGAPFRVAKKEFRETDKIITYSAGEQKQETYDIDLKCAIQLGNDIVVMINIDKECQYSLHEVKQIIGASDYDLLITKKVIAQIIAKIRNATEPYDKSKLGMLIIVGLLGLVGGVMLGIMVYPMVIPPHVVTQIVTVTPTPSVPPYIFNP